MRFRKLRIAWSVFWAVAGVLLIVLWVRSYWWINQAQLVVANTGTFVVVSQGGVVMAGIHDRRIGVHSSVYSHEITREELKVLQTSRWAPRLSLRAREVSAPYWFPVVACVATSALPWPRWKFSLRTLLIATTLVAVVLGLAVYAAS